MCWFLLLQATFKITLVVPSDLVALSNMPIAEEKIDGNLKTVVYQESPIMSTYLVAVVVGFFAYVENFTDDGIISLSFVVRELIVHKKTLHYRFFCMQG